MFCTALGVKTHYQKIGQGTPLVLLHGWGCTWEIWAPVIPQLSESFQLIIPDLPGFGKSEHASEGWSSKNYASWLNEFIKEAVGEKKFLLAGHSFGGKIASIYSAHFATKNLAQLFIVDASGLPDSLSEQKKLQQSIISVVPDFLKERIPFTIKQKIFTSLSASDDYLAATPYQKLVLKKVLSEYIAQDLEKIKIPTVVFWGIDDQATPIHQGEKFVELIPNATLILFQHSGHYPFIDETELFIQQILASAKTTP